jgi:hypothetical protein
MIQEGIRATGDLAVPDLHDIPQDVKLLPLAELIAADSPRLSGINQRHAQVLAESDDDLPQILVQKETMRIIDGMHRIHAAQLKGHTHIAARVLDIDDDAAFLLAVQANIAHGLPLSLADRKAAAARIIRTNSFWSDRAIARVAGLSGKTVGALREREQMGGSPTERRMGQDGKIRPISGTTGRRLAGELLTVKPGARVREIAMAAGVSEATVRDVRERLLRGEDALTPGQLGQAAHGAPANARRLVRGSAPLLDAADGSSLEKLMRDPALRYSDAGRALLRLLHMRPSSLAAEELIKALPAHCLTMTAQLSRQIALEWVNLAATIDKHGQAETAYRG